MVHNDPIKKARSNYATRVSQYISDHLHFPFRLDSHNRIRIFQMNSGTTIWHCANVATMKEKGDYCGSNAIRRQTNAENLKDACQAGLKLRELYSVPTYFRGKVLTIIQEVRKAFNLLVIAVLFQT